MFIIFMSTLSDSGSHYYINIKSSHIKSDIESILRSSVLLLTLSLLLFSVISFFLNCLSSAIENEENHVSQ